MRSPALATAPQPGAGARRVTPAPAHTTRIAQPDTVAVPTPSGWITLHASLPEGGADGRVAIVLERTASPQTTALRLEAHGVTRPRARDRDPARPRPHQPRDRRQARAVALHRSGSHQEPVRKDRRLLTPRARRPCVHRRLPTSSRPANTAHIQRQLRPAPRQQAASRTTAKLTPDPRRSSAPPVPPSVMVLAAHHPSWRSPRDHLLNQRGSRPSPRQAPRRTHPQANGRGRRRAAAASTRPGLRRRGSARGPASAGRAPPSA